ncbi:MAG TPA: EscU/YscU/HrcU family type III secretion system export apparatus switch protein [Kofleriaceae bacterium]|jgi:flagellar biosynthesis protein FlhB
MADQRPFPPSARRTSLARAAGLTAASPLLVGGVACGVAALLLAAMGRGAVAQLGAWMRDGVAASSSPSPDDLVLSGSLAHLAERIASLALPLLGAIALAAAAAHLAQTRSAWLPRRRLPDAPTLAPRRGTYGSLGLVNGVVIGGVTVGWLYAMAPRLAALGVVPQAGALLVISFLAALATTWIALGALDALVRFAAYTADMRMTRDEQRADARAAGADPRWAQRRRELARSTPARDAVAGASVLVLGDGIAVAVAWDPLRRPIPTRTAVGRAARATQLLGLARRHAVAVHRDPALAVALATDDGPVPQAHWARLAEIIAAVRGRRS